MIEFIGNTDGTITTYRDLTKLADATRTKIELLSIEIEMLEAQQEEFDQLENSWCDIENRIEKLMEEQMGVSRTFAYIEEMRTSMMTEELE